MYELCVDGFFSAAHFLRGYEGKCSRLHGHNWKVAMSVEVSELDEIGIGIDFTLLRAILKEVLAMLDHTNLNDLNYFVKKNPTAENIAKMLFDSLAEKLNGSSVTLVKLKVWESETSSATYSS